MAATYGRSRRPGQPAPVNARSAPVRLLALAPGGVGDRLTGMKYLRLSKLGPSVCVAALLILGGCSSNPASEQTGNRAAQSTNDPDQLMLLALRAGVSVKDWKQALELAQRAASADPKRPELAWLHLRICAATSRCDPAPLEAQFRKLAPRNAAVWLGPLQRAQMQKDAQVEAQLIDSMSQSPQFNLYWTTLMHRLTAAAMAMPNPGERTPLTSSLAEIAGFLGALVPPFAPLTTTCNAETARNPERRLACERIAELLERSDTYLGEAVGLGIAERIVAPNSTAMVEVKQRVVVSNYRRETAGSLVNAQLEREKFSAELLKLFQSLPREQDVSLAILRWGGEPLEP